jgi:hypothetical protein
VRQYHYASCPVGCSDDHPELGVTDGDFKEVAPSCPPVPFSLGRMIDPRDCQLPDLKAKLAEAERGVKAVEAILFKTEDDLVELREWANGVAEGIGHPFGFRRPLNRALRRIREALLLKSGADGERPK